MTFELSGLIDSIPFRIVFKRKATAMNFKEKNNVTKWELYDKTANKYIDGNTDFYEALKNGKTTLPGSGVRNRNTLQIIDEIEAITRRSQPRRSSGNNTKRDSDSSSKNSQARAKLEQLFEVFPKRH